MISIKELSKGWSNLLGKVISVVLTYLRCEKKQGKIPFDVLVLLLFSLIYLV